MNHPASSIVVIDDEAPIRKLLATALKGAGYRVYEAGSGNEGLVEVAQRQPDLALLDLGLPDMDGLDVLRHLREWSNLPVIILTVRDDPDEKIAALDAGADDFVTKPFHAGELLARIRSVSKRITPSEQEAVITIGPLRIDFLERIAHVGQQRLDLTPIEFRLLQTLARHAGKIVTKTQLLREIWGATSTSSDDHLRVHLAAVRRKLRPHHCDRFIVTETGVGYRLVGPER